MAGLVDQPASVYRLAQFQLPDPLNEHDDPRRGGMLDAGHVAVHAQGAGPQKLIELFNLDLCALFQACCDLGVPLKVQDHVIV